MAGCDWHSDPILPATPVAAAYRNTQNVRRFFRSQGGEHCTFDRPFMVWLVDGTPRTMGDAVDAWLQRSRRPRS